MRSHMQLYHKIFSGCSYTLGIKTLMVITLSLHGLCCSKCGASIVHNAHDSHIDEICKI